MSNSRSSPQEQNQRAQNGPSILDQVDISMSPLIDSLLASDTKSGLRPRDQYRLLRTQIAPGCTDEELALFLHVAKMRGLDPFAKQIYAIRRKSRAKDSYGEWVDVFKMTIQTGIDGFRLIAARAGLEAQEKPIFRYEESRKNLLNPLGLVSCEVSVWKKGATRPTTSEAFWDEYKQLADEYDDSGRKTGSKKLTGKWADMPHGMLAKVTEAISLRRQFPEDLSGLYIDEEMDQADNARDDERASSAQSPATPATTPTSALPAKVQQTHAAEKSEAAIVAELKKEIDGINDIPRLDRWWKTNKADRIEPLSDASYDAIRAYSNDRVNKLDGVVDPSGGDRR